MAIRVSTLDLKVGMFVADLDRPWVDTPFLLQGFLVEDDDQVAALRMHCDFVMVDRARSVGDQYEAPAAVSLAIARPPGPPAAARPNAAANVSTSATRAEMADSPDEVGVATASHGVATARAKPRMAGERLRLEDVARGPAPDAGDGVLGRMVSGLKGLLGRKAAMRTATATGAQADEVIAETPQEFEARAALLPPGIAVQTYVTQVTVEEEAPRAREVVTQASDLLEKLVSDVRLGQSFEVERVEEIVEGMVDSIVRNPQAMMWVAKLRQEDIATYGHGLQVSVYLTSLGRHLGFPKAQLAQLAQTGLLLDIGKIRLPRELLDKQGRLTDAEFESAKAHVAHGLEILRSTPGFQDEVLSAIEQHHERMNGSGYPRGLAGADISIYGRMAGIVDTFAALTNHRPYAAAVSSYDALRSLSGWAGEFFHEALVQQFVSSVGVFPVGSLIELSSGEVAVVVEHSKVRRLKPRVLVVTGPDKTPAPFPAMLDLLYDPHAHSGAAVFIKRGLAPGSFGLDLRDFYLA